MLSSRYHIGGEWDLIPYDEAGRLVLGLPGEGVLGGLGETSGADICPGLPSAVSPCSFVSLGACSSPAGAGLCRATYHDYAISGQFNLVSVIHVTFTDKLKICVTQNLAKVGLGRTV